jgi:hypothetical protein
LGILSQARFTNNLFIFSVPAALELQLPCLGVLSVSPFIREDYSRMLARAEVAVFKIHTA